jgi:hypothetical protein
MFHFDFAFTETAYQMVMVISRDLVTEMSIAGLGWTR